jgi:hypothetical protein
VNPIKIKPRRLKQLLMLNLFGFFIGYGIVSSVQKQYIPIAERRSLNVPREFETWSSRASPSPK